MLSCRITWSFSVSRLPWWWFYTKSSKVFFLLMGKCMSALFKIDNDIEYLQQYISMPILLRMYILIRNLASSLIFWSLNARGRLRGMNSNSRIPLSRVEVSSSLGKDTQGVVLTTDEKVCIVCSLCKCFIDIIHTRRGPFTIQPWPSHFKRQSNGE